jgi:hypothetical protein
MWRYIRAQDRTGMLQHTLAVGLANWLEAYVAENLRARSRGVATRRQPRRVVLHHQQPAWPNATVPGYAQAPLAVPEAEGRGGRRGLNVFIDAAACLHGFSCNAMILYLDLSLWRWCQCL